MPRNNSRNRPGVKVRQPPPLAPFDERQRRVRRPSPGGPPAKTKHAARVIITEGFWRDFPWKQMNYLSVNYYDAPVVGDFNLWTEVVPAGQVYIISSVIFRAYLDIGVPTPLLAPDAYLVLRRTFSFTVDGVVPWDLREGNTPVAITTPTTLLLNHDLLVPGMPFQIVAQQGQTISADALVALAVDPPELTLVAVEARGIIVSQNEFNLYSARMGV